MRAVRLLSLRYLVEHPLRTAMALLAVAAGVALVVTIFVVQTSVTRSFTEYGRTLSGPTDLRVVGPVERGGLEWSVVERIEAVDGVDGAVPLVQAVTVAVNASGDERFIVALGVDCRVERLIGEFGCDPDQLPSAPDRPLVAGAELASWLGSGGAIRTDVGRVPTDDVVSIDALGDLNGGNVAVFALPSAQRLFARPDRLDVVYVEPASGVSATELREPVERAAGEWNRVLGVDDPPGSVVAVLGSFLPLFTLLGLFALGTGAVLVHNVVSLSIAERRRQIAVTAAIGAPPRVVLSTTVAESALIGFAGGLVGAGLGVLVAVPIVASLSDFSEQTAGVHLDTHVSAFPLIVGVVLGGVVAAGAAFGPGRRGSRIEIAAELSGRGTADDEAAPRLRGRIVRWAAVAGVGAWLCWLSQRGGALEPWQAAIGPVGFLLAVVGMLLCSAAVAPVLASLLARFRGSVGSATAMAITNSIRAPGRTGVVSIAVASAVAVAFLAASFLSAAAESISRDVTRNLEGVAVSTLEPSNSSAIDAKPSPDLLASLERLPEVASIERGNRAVVSDGATQIGVGAWEEPWLSGTVYDGTADRARLEAGEVLIGAALARSTGVRAGDELRLPTSTGYVHLPVQGVWSDGSFNGSNVTMSYQRFVEIFGDQPPESVNAIPADGVSTAALAAAIERADLDPDLRALEPSALVDVIVDSIDAQMQPFWILQRGLLGVAFVAVLSTLLLVGVQRQRELGLLGAVGMDPATTARMVMIEAVIVGAIGVVLGAVFGLACLWAMTQIAPLIMGFRNPIVPDWWSLVIYGGVSIVIVLLASIAPSVRAARVQIVDALRYE